MLLTRSTVSPLQLFRSLSDPERQELLSGLSDEAKAQLAFRWRGWQARPAQVPPDGDWRYWLVMAGRGFGKTRLGAEWVRESVAEFEFVNLIAATADDARDIMVEGESGILSVCPSWERPDYQPSKRQLVWPNGAKSLIFTADEPERLRGKQHMRVWADEIAAWRYPEAWVQMTLGLRIGHDPRAVATTTPKPVPLIRELVKDPDCIVTRGATYDNLDNLADAFAGQIIRRYEGTRLGRQELDGELLEDEGLAYPFSERTHVVGSFELPVWWSRFESMDFGTTNPTAWLAWAADDEGSLLVFDEFYEPGLPSITAPKLLQRREWWHPQEPALCFADPSIWSDAPVTNRWGAPASAADEFQEHGISLKRANNDRRAGFIRLSELIRVDPERAFPRWHPRAGELGAPRLFVFDRCTSLVEQLKDAPLETAEDGPFPGEAVNRKWEGPHGHAHAAARYGAMSWAPASEEPDREPDDPRAALLQRVERQRDRQLHEVSSQFAF